MKKFSIMIVVMMMLVSITSAVSAEVNAVTPSTNEINIANGWAHVVVNETGVGYVDLNFVNPRALWSCFEYRTDGDTTQASGANYNPLVTDGLYPYTCLNDDSETMTLYAYDYVEIRMVFGGETDERFDWTRFDVIQGLTNKEQCKNYGWMEFNGPDGLPFKNQGQCIQFVNTGK